MNEKYNYRLEAAVLAFRSVQRFKRVLERKQTFLQESLRYLDNDEFNEYIRRTNEETDRQTEHETT